MSFRYDPETRSAKTQALIALWAAGLVALRLGLGAAWGWLVLLALPLVPALWEQIRNPRRWLVLEPDVLRWHDGISQQEVRLDRIKEVRLDTRWDLSIRARLDLISGDRVRLPPPVTPQNEDFEAALQAQGLSVTRHHFRVF